MKKAYLSFSIILLVLTNTLSQSVLIADFEDGQNSTTTGSFYKWGDGTITVVQNPIKNAVNESDYVLRKSHPEGQQWGAVALWNSGGHELYKSEYEYLKFDIFIPDGDGDINEIKVIIKGQNSDSGGVNFESTEKTVTATGEWQQLLFNLEDLTIFDYQQLGIQVDDNDFGAFYIDNIYWVSASTALSQLNNKIIDVSFSNGSIQLHNVFNSNVTVYSLTGLKVYESMIQTSPWKIHLPKGIYFVKTDGKKVTKVIVK